MGICYCPSEGTKMVNSFPVYVIEVKNHQVSHFKLSKQTRAPSALAKGTHARITQCGTSHTAHSLPSNVVCDDGEKREAE
jgi:hypothetical protein